MLGNKLFSSETTMSYEMIEPQTDDAVVDKLEIEYDKLINLADKFSTKIVSANAFFKHKEALAVIQNIDNIISNRFGITIQHVNGTGIGYAVLTVPPVNLNTIAGDIEQRFKQYKQELGKGCSGDDAYCVPEVTEKNVKAKKYIKDVFKDNKSVMYHTYVAHLKLEETLKTKGVTIDLKKAKMTNLPKDYQLFVLADFFMLIRRFKLSARELVAVLMHEVGHGFTHLEYSYKTVKNTSVIIDGLRKDLAKGKSVNEVLTLAYKKVGGTEDISKGNDSVTAIKFIDKYMQSTLNMSEHDRHSFTDSEQLADQFANRFGLGTELVSGLNKLHEAPLLPVTANNVISISILALLMIVVTIVMLPAVLTFLVAYTFLTITFGGDDANNTTYDKKLRRYKRIKNDMIKVLRTTKMDKKVVRRILTELETVDKIIENASKDTSILEKLGNNLLPWNNKVSSFQKLEELLEDMSDNSLYIASNKLKTI